MKFNDILLEAADARLLHYVSSNDDFYKVGPDYVFIWNNTILPELIKNGANPGTHLKRLRTPSKGSDGIGIVSIRTGDICVGAIDRDYTALWVSSVEDTAEFFRRIQSRKIRSLTGRLQELGDLYQQHSEEEAGTRVTSSGIQAILDTINKNDDYEKIKDDAETYPEILDIESMKPSEAKSHFQETIRKLKNREKILEKQTSKIYDLIREKEDELSDEEISNLIDKAEKIGGQELHGIRSLVKELERFIRSESDLFIDSDEDELDSEEDETEETDTDNEIALWMEQFESDFPGLDLRSPYQFDPNV